MMIQIEHRESHDIDIFIDDAQILGFLDPAKAELNFETRPAEYAGDGARFQRFAFSDVGEIDYIISGSLTAQPFVSREIGGRSVKLETLGEIVAKKVYYRGGEAKPRDIFDMAAAAEVDRAAVLSAISQYPEKVSAMIRRLDTLDPNFVEHTVDQLMILPGFRGIVSSSLSIARALLVEALQQPAS
jgi:hypothetical protein